MLKKSNSINPIKWRIVKKILLIEYLTHQNLPVKDKVIKKITIKRSSFKLSILNHVVTIKTSRE